MPGSQTWMLAWLSPEARRPAAALDQSSAKPSVECRCACSGCGRGTLDLVGSEVAASLARSSSCGVPSNTCGGSRAVLSDGSVKGARCAQHRQARLLVSMHDSPSWEASPQQCCRLTSTINMCRFWR